MKTRVVRIAPDNIDANLIKEAARVIRQDGLVAFPTETVYGLGANALEAVAVKKIFDVKERPHDDPLIVHLSKREDLDNIALDISEKAAEVTRVFWPGPLTIIFRKDEKVPDIVTSGLDTVAVRVPSNPIARRLIEEAGVPIAAPSANMFGRVSPTTAGHVLADLDGKIDMVIDGGKSDIGIESTVIQFIGENSCLVHRHGGTTMEGLEAIIKTVSVAKKGSGTIKKSPGKYLKHYAPKASIIIVEDGPDQVNKTVFMADYLSGKGRKIGIMAKDEHASSYRKYKYKIAGADKDLTRYAAALFSTLREFDKEGVDTIIAEGVKEKYLGFAIMDRLRKASGQ